MLVFCLGVVIAFSSFIGVAVALVYYMIEVQRFSSWDIVLAEVIYMVLALIILIGVWRKLG